LWYNRGGAVKRLGIEHWVVTGKQMPLYMAFAKEGRPLTWNDVKKIETEALIKSNMDPALAADMVSRAITNLKSAGVTRPRKIPWGK